MNAQPPEQGTVPTSAADATEEVNQQQAADQAKAAEEHPQGVQPAEPIRVPDERVPSHPNPVVGADQPVTDPDQQQGPDQNEDKPDVEPNPEPETEPSH
jgi:hypothetical protein